jgi:hypothetical protein
MTTSPYTLTGAEFSPHPQMLTIPKVCNVRLTEAHSGSDQSQPRMRIGLLLDRFSTKRVSDSLVQDVMSS